MNVDVAIIGAGFFGCEIALELKRLGYAKVALFEREHAIMQRASFVNQARVHNGYHYPRSVATAERSRENFERFVSEYDYAIDDEFEHVYAIARQSRVTASQFERFCSIIGAPVRPAPARLGRLFDRSMVEQVFAVREYAFDSTAISRRLIAALQSENVNLCLETEARIDQTVEGGVILEAGGETIRARYVFNCTYAGLDATGVTLRATVKRELAEIGLIQVPPELKQVGITVMDGPFFSTMPFPPGGCHSLSHVRYTPHAAWNQAESHEPKPDKSQYHAMLRDACRFVPCLVNAKAFGSMFELKAVLARNEGDDGRPILFEHHSEKPRVISVLGAKIDNVYDIRNVLRERTWEIH